MCFWTTLAYPLRQASRRPSKSNNIPPYSSRRTGWHFAAIHLCRRSSPSTYLARFTSRRLYSHIFASKGAGRSPSPEPVSRGRRFRSWRITPRPRPRWTYSLRALRKRFANLVSAVSYLSLAALPLSLASRVTGLTRGLASIALPLPTTTHSSTSWWSCLWRRFRLTSPGMWAKSRSGLLLLLEVREALEVRIGLFGLFLGATFCIWLCKSVQNSWYWRMTGRMLVSVPTATGITIRQARGYCE